MVDGDDKVEIPSALGWLFNLWIISGLSTKLVKRYSFNMIELCLRSRQSLSLAQRISVTHFSFCLVFVSFVWFTQFLFDKVLWIFFSDNCNAGWALLEVYWKAGYCTDDIWSSRPYYLWQGKIAIGHWVIVFFSCQLEAAFSWTKWFHWLAYFENDIG